MTIFQVHLKFGTVGYCRSDLLCTQVVSVFFSGNSFAIPAHLGYKDGATTASKDSKCKTHFLLQTDRKSAAVA